MAYIAGPVGPADYARHPGENVQCPACLKYNDGDAQFCDQCGAPLPGWGDAYQRQPGEIVPCTHCGKFDMPDARFCDQCGKILPPAAYAAAKTAQAEKQATSSSGRTPVGRQWTPQERTQYLRQRAERAERDARVSPQLTGNSMRDQVLLEEAMNRALGFWERADMAWRDANAGLESARQHASSRAEVGEAAQQASALRAEADLAWRDYERAKARCEPYWARERGPEIDYRRLEAIAEHTRRNLGHGGRSER